MRLELLHHLLDIFGQNEALIGVELARGFTPHNALAVVQELVRANIPPRTLHEFTNKIRGKFVPQETFFYAA